MMRWTGGLLLSCLLVLGACRSDPSTPTTVDSLEALSDRLGRGYERLADAYDSRRDSLSPEARRMYEEMGRMHAEMGGAADAGPMSGAPMEDGHMMGRDGGEGGHGHGMDRSPTNDEPSPPDERQERHQQMMGMHGQMGRLHERAGRDRLADRHRRMRRRHRRMRRALPDSGREDSSQPPGAAPPAARLSGRQLYVQHCATCHGPDGQGIGTFPPLARSAWAAGPTDAAVRILLHGLQGEVTVRGRTYDGLMPAFGERLSNADVAAVLSFLRSRWGNAADSVTAPEVREVRHRDRDRTAPWTAEELRPAP